jgi:ribosomal protein S18 acetylase RimI-like enzyme
LEQPHKVNRLKCVTYADERLPDFLRTLEATYEGSLDCPHLSGLRDTLDVFRGHQHTGIGHPSLWFLAYMDNEPVGILLMAGVVDRPCLEIVYMGVDARARGRRIGDALLSQAFSVARERRSEALTLAVDGNNVYAWRLYRRWGFRETTRRRAWIAHQAK